MVTAHTVAQQLELDPPDASSGAFSSAESNGLTEERQTNSRSLSAVCSVNSVTEIEKVSDPRPQGAKTKSENGGSSASKEDRNQKVALISNSLPRENSWRRTTRWISYLLEVLLSKVKPYPVILIVPLVAVVLITGIATGFSHDSADPPGSVTRTTHSPTNMTPGSGDGDPKGKGSMTTRSPMDFRGTLLMDCGTLDDPQDICWIDEHSFVTVQNLGQSVKVFTLGNNTCRGHTIDSGYRASRVSCGSDKKIYVIDAHNHVIKVYYNGNMVEEWNPEYLSNPGTISVNSHSIVASGKGMMFVYDKSKNFKHKVSFNGSEVNVYFTYLTDSDILFSTTWSAGNRVFIQNLSNNTTVDVGSLGGRDGHFNFLLDVCAGPEEATVLVCDSDNHRISVLSPQGQFLRELNVDREIRYPKAIAVRDDLMVLASRASNGNKIEIFRLIA